MRYKTIAGRALLAGLCALALGSAAAAQTSSTPAASKPAPVKLAPAASVPATAAPASNSEASIPVTVEMGDVSLTKLPFIIAAENGIFTKNGLKADLFITPGAAAVVRAAGVIVPPQNIRSGVTAEINIGGGSPNVVRMTTVATFPRRVILATMDPIARFHIIARKGITNVKQLKGKRIGYEAPGSLDQLSLLFFFRQQGWNPARDVEMYSQGGDPGAIMRGEVDAFAGSEIAITAAKKLGLNDLVDLAKYRYPMPGSGVNVLASWLKDNHEGAKRFMKATVEAIAMMKTNKDAAYAALRKWFGVQDPAKLAAIFASAKNLPSKPYPSIAGLKKMHEVYDWRALNISKPTDFADPSYIAALDKSGYIDSLYGGKAPGP
jgi:NitT/TauT family transport system substrate-binding protein